MFDIHYFESVGSTMDIARDCLMHERVVQAGEQTGGRGRRGNQWLSPKGNLYQSIILKPTCDKSLWGQLSFVIAVALARSCREVGIGGDDINLKWPNDVLINEQKLAGILIEACDDHVIIGTGVNIEHAPVDRSKITDFCDVSVDGFRDVFLKYIEHYYTQWETHGFDDIRTEWISRAYKLNEPIQARLPNVIYDGVFEGLDESGTLLLREKGGYLRHINSGEIIV
jgi:BirA family biotin operon repressor/biotin-[acetyl-CoA-carboxylase] ligase